MSRRDKYHYNVKEALEKEGWKVTDDPYILRVKDEKNIVKSFPVDLGAEKLIAAEKGTIKIAIEVKTFEESSVINAYHKALGQYMDYLAGLELQEPNRKLYLAISTKAYQALMENPLSKLSLRRFNVRVIIVNINTNRIVQWID